MCSCTTEKNDEQLNAKDTAELLTKETLQCIIDNNIDSLIQLFCQKVSDECDLEEQLSDFSAFIDGKVISYNDLKWNISAITKEDGEITYQELFGWIKELKTDKGNSYFIRISSVYQYVDHEEYIGINSITITSADNDGSNCIVGLPL